MMFVAICQFCNKSRKWEILIVLTSYPFPIFNIQITIYGCFKSNFIEKYLIIINNASYDVLKSDTRCMKKEKHQKTYMFTICMHIYV